MDADPTPDPEPSSRRFAIGDLMVLIVGLALLLSGVASTTAPARLIGWMRAAPGLVRYVYFDGPPTKAFARVPKEHIRRTFWDLPRDLLGESLAAFLIVATPTVLLWRLRKPRPPWKRVACQPGAVACFAALAEVLIEVDLRWMGVALPTHFDINIGLAVASSWTILLITRHWRSERGWIDRLGRIVGVGWIVVAVLAAIARVRPG